MTSARARTLRGDAPEGPGTLPAHRSIPRSKRRGVAQAKPDYNPLVGPWEANKETRLSVRQGRLVMETTDGHPSIVTHDVPDARGDVVLEFRVRSTASGRGGCSGKPIK